MIVVHCWGRSRLALVILNITHQGLVLKVKQCLFSLPDILCNPAFNQSFIYTSHVFKVRFWREYRLLYDFLRSFWPLGNERAFTGMSD